MKRWPLLRFVALSVVVSGFVSCRDTGGAAPPGAAPVSSLQAKAADSQAPVTAWVMLKDQRAPTVTAATRRDWRALGRDVYGQLTSRAATSQSSLVTFLSSRGIAHKAFWIVNAVQVTADKATLAEIAKLPEVGQVLPDRTYSIPPVRKALALPRPTATEWGLNNIRAPEAWATFGNRGENIVVANIDTGVQFDHPALVQQYRGNKGDGTFDHNYNWFDPENACGATPCDQEGHGTHTMGTMVGDDGNPGANQIGVAPKARWIAAKGCCGLDALISSFQWVMAPTDMAGQNPSPELRAHVVNNSWGGPSGDPLFQAAVQAWVAAGIFPVFSNGNGGPGCGSAGSPGDYPETYGVGAYDIRNVIADFSSRGASSFGGIIKPNISAPGVAVRSSVPGNGYDSFSGTSMASPHVAGVVALLWSSAPALFGEIEATRAILDTTAVDTADLACGGTPENNNVFGEGRLDAYAAVEAAPRGPTGTLQGTVTAAGGAPIAGAVIRAVGGDATRTVRTDASGAYSLVLPVGAFQVTASAFGYLSETREGVTITEGATTVADFALAAAPSYTVTGRVLDGAGNPHAGAKVNVVGTPLPTATTDAEGRYTIPSVPVGSYDVRAQAGRCFEQQTRPLVVDGDEVLDFVLNQRKDAYGHFCQLIPTQFIEAGTVLPLTGDDASVTVPLPFAFTFYGQTYESVGVTTNGFITFTPGASPFPPYLNTPIPEKAEPNAAIYALWDDLVVDATGSVRTQVVGDAPNRQFVIEWRDVAFLANGLKTRFEIVLHENGKVLVQHAPPTDDPMQRGSAATIGLEDESGAVAFQYSYNEEVVDPASGILFGLPPSGFVQGTVTDANDRLPIAGTEVRALQGGRVVRSTRTNSRGGYRLQLEVGSYLIEAGTGDYRSEQKPATVTLDGSVTVDFALQTARAEVRPATIQLVMPKDQLRTRALSLENTGSVNLVFEISEAGGQRQRTTISTSRLTLNAAANPNASTTRGLFGPGITAAGWGPSAPGNVVRSFVPMGVAHAWGLGFTSQLWVSDLPVGMATPPPAPPPPGSLVAQHNHEYTPQGVATGRAWPTSWAGIFAADMAYHPGRNLVCQLAVGADNGIHCWNPATGAVEDSIAGSLPWTGTSQRGLAYRADDDSFYVGGWNQQVIFHIKGLSHPDKGAVIGQCTPADGAISGLAWNGSMGVLWAATNSPTDSVYELNPDDCTVLSVLPHPAPGFQGAGLEMDESGDLWMVSQNTNTVSLVESGVPAFSDVPWLSVAPASGTLAPGQKRTLTVVVETNGLQAGTYLATLFVTSNSGREARKRIPVSLTVTDYQQGVNAGGGSYQDRQGDTWTADRRHSEGSWGYVQASTTRATSHDIGRSEDPVLYQSQRHGSSCFARTAT